MKNLLNTLRDRFGQRLSRTSFFGYGLIARISALGLTVLYGFLVNDTHGWQGIPITIIGLALTIFQFYLIVRRLHDFNRSGWWAIFLLLPLEALPYRPVVLAYSILVIVVSLLLLFIPGTRGTNRYGMRPGFEPLKEPIGSMIPPKTS